MAVSLLVCLCCQILYMGNVYDGWNFLCGLRPTKRQFVTNSLASGTVWAV